MAKLSGLTQTLKNIPKATAQVAGERMKSLGKSIIKAPGRLVKGGLLAVASGIAKEMPEVAALGGAGASIVSDIARKASFKKIPKKDIQNPTPVMSQQPAVQQPAASSVPSPLAQNNTGEEVSKLLTPLKQILASVHHIITQNDKLYSEVRSLTEITRSGLDVTKKSLNESRKANRLLVERENIRRFKAQESAGIQSDAEAGKTVPKMTKVSKEGPTAVTSLLGSTTSGIAGGVAAGAGIGAAKGIGNAVGAVGSKIGETVGKIGPTASKVLSSPLTKLAGSFGPQVILAGVASFIIPAIVDTIKDFKFTDALDYMTESFKKYGLIGALGSFTQELVLFLTTFRTKLNDSVKEFATKTWEAITNFDFLKAAEDLFSVVAEALFGPEGTQEIAEGFSKIITNMTDKYLSLKKAVIEKVMSIVPDNTGWDWIDKKLKSIRESLTNQLSETKWDASINKGEIPEMTKGTPEKMSFVPQPTQETINAATVTVGNQALEQNKSALEQQRVQPQVNAPVTTVSAPITSNSQTVFNTNTPSVRPKDSFYSP